MVKITPTTPLRATYRLMLRLVAISSKGSKVDPRPEELDMCARVFSRAGGSWESVFTGGIEDMTLLKSVLKVASDQGYFTTKPKWG